MEEDKKTGETAADSGETVDGGQELPEVEKVITDDDKLGKVETAPPVPETPKKTAPVVPGVTPTPQPSGMEYGAPAETVRYQEGVRRRSVWWHITTLVGLAVIIGLLVFQQFNGAEKVIAAVVDDGNTTRVDNGAAVDKVVAAIVADGNLTREGVSDVADDVGYAQEIDGDNVRLALTEQKKLLKRFQELVVADPDVEDALPGFLNIVAGLVKETRDDARGVRRLLVRHDKKLDDHERASASRASALEGYLESLSSQYGTTALGIRELRDRAERPLKVRVIIPRTKTVVVDRK